MSDICENCTNCLYYGKWSEYIRNTHGDKLGIGKLLCPCLNCLTDLNHVVNGKIMIGYYNDKDLTIEELIIMRNKFGDYDDPPALRDLMKIARNALPNLYK